jgi:hypothetical protein
MNVWFPFMCIPINETVISKTELYNVLSPSSYTLIYICERFIYISRIGLPIPLQGNIGIYKSLTDTNVEIWTEAAQFPEKKYINWDFPCSVV